MSPRGRQLKTPLVRRLVWVLAVFLTILCLITGIVVYFFDDILRSEFNKLATSALGVPAGVKRVRVNIFTGSINLNALSVANPEGFTKGDFLSIHDISASLNVASLNSNMIRVNEVEISGVTLNIEQRADLTNYKSIIENIVKTKNRLAQNSSTDASGAPTRHLVINRLIIRDVTVNAVEYKTAGAEPDHQNFVLDRIELTQIGTDSDQGVVMEQVVSLVTVSILRQTVIQGIGKLPITLISGLGDGVQLIGDVGIKGVMFGGKLLISIGTTVIQGVGDVIDGVFGGGAKKPQSPSSPPASPTPSAPASPAPPK